MKRKTFVSLYVLIFLNFQTSQAGTHAVPMDHQVETIVMNNFTIQNNEIVGSVWSLQANQVIMLITGAIWMCFALASVVSIVYLWWDLQLLRWKQRQSLATSTTSTSFMLFSSSNQTTATDLEQAQFPQPPPPPPVVLTSVAAPITSTNNNNARHIAASHRTVRTQQTQLQQATSSSASSLSAGDVARSLVSFCKKITQKNGVSL
jgi:hypothetical protein